jgi:hypothetical protein
MLYLLPPSVRLQKVVALCCQVWPLCLRSPLLICLSTEDMPQALTQVAHKWSWGGALVCISATASCVLRRHRQNQQRLLHSDGKLACKTAMMASIGCITLFGLQEPIEHGLRLLFITRHGERRPLGAALCERGPLCVLPPPLMLQVCQSPTSGVNTCHRQPQS